MTLSRYTKSVLKVRPALIYHDRMILKWLKFYAHVSANIFSALVIGISPLLSKREKASLYSAICSSDSCSACRSHDSQWRLASCLFKQPWQWPATAKVNRAVAAESGAGSHHSLPLSTTKTTHCIDQQVGSPYEQCCCAVNKRCAAASAPGRRSTGWQTDNGRTRPSRTAGGQSAGPSGFNTIT